VFSRAYNEDILTKFEGYQKGDSYASTCPENLKLNPDVKLLPSPERPFGVWFRKNFPGIGPVHGFSMYGSFAVAREHILQHPVEYYQNLIKYLNHHHNPEAIHFFEIGWAAVFHPIPDECLAPCLSKDEFVLGCDEFSTAASSAPLNIPSPLWIILPLILNPFLALLNYSFQ
jgi:hypothetical protein